MSGTHTNRDGIMVNETPDQPLTPLLLESLVDPQRRVYAQAVETLIVIEDAIYERLMHSMRLCPAAGGEAYLVTARNGLECLSCGRIGLDDPSQDDALFIASVQQKFRLLAAAKEYGEAYERAAQRLLGVDWEKISVGSGE